MVVFLSCTKSKKNYRCKAKEMYSESDIFTKSLKYAEKLKPDHIYILSAKHHVLELDDVISPYSETLNDATVEERKEWTEKVISQLKNKHVNFSEKTYFLCRENYTEFLEEHFSDCENLYDNKGGIGDIMHWLDTKINENKSYKMKSLHEYINELITK